MVFISFHFFPFQFLFNLSVSLTAVFACTLSLVNQQTQLYLSILFTMDDQDYSQLPLEEKLSHKVWKVRLDGYNTLSSEFGNLRNAQDPVFSTFNVKPDLVRAMVTDSNVVAQEAGMLVLVNYLQFGGTSANVAKLKNAGVIGSICEKGLSSSRAGTKAKAVDALLIFVEIFNSGEPVLEAVIPFFDNKLPKLVAGCVNAVYQMVEQFGCGIVSPKSIIAKLPKLFAHADRAVRGETTKLTVEMYKWMGDGLTTILFADLKPIQQRDLTAEFEKVKGVKAEQKKLTRFQQEELESQKALAAGDNGDIDMEESVLTEQAPEFSAYDMLEPVDVLSKLPGDLNSRVASAKWKDRKEALDEVYEVLSKAPKLANDDYTDLVRVFAKCMKDANIQVVQLAANGIEFLSKGLQSGFHRYQNLVVGGLIERSKEKKPSVAEALANALDSIFINSSLSDILDETINGMKHKTPQVKISATNYLQRCLASTTTAPNTVQIDVIMEAGLKLLTDSLEPIRQAATEMVGTLMKITGERELRTFLDKIDDNRIAKVKAVFEKAVVKCSSSRTPSSTASSVNGPTRANAQRVVPSRLNVAPTLKKLAAPQSIPSKRLATSPAKRADGGSKILPSARSFTGRLLISPATSTIAAELQPPSTTTPEKEELNLLRRENASLTEQNEQLQRTQLEWTQDQLKYKEEIENLRTQYDQSHKDYTNVSLLVKQRDTQILRLNSDLESAKLKIKSLEQTIEMIKLQQTTQKDPLLQPFLDKRSPYRSPERLPKFTLSELNTRVNHLSIEEGMANPTNTDEFTSTASVDESTSRRSVVSDRTNVFHSTQNKEIVSEEENWRKAAEVTAQLKARIEKMKQRNRLAMNR